MAKDGAQSEAKSQRYDLKLKQILKKSAVVFARKGFHNASVRDISRETGISLAGLYYYFQTKEELLFLIMKDTFESVVAALDASIDQYQGPERIRFFIENHLRYFVENLPQMKVASHEIDSLKGKYRKEVQRRQRHYFERLVAILNDEVKHSSTSDPKVAALALFGMVNWIYTWYETRQSEPIDPIIEVMSTIFLNGYVDNE